MTVRYEDDEKRQQIQGKRTRFLYTREGRSTLAKPESAIVRYEWLSRWTFPYPSRYILWPLWPTRYFDVVLETPIEYHCRARLLDVGRWVRIYR